MGQAPGRCETRATLPPSRLVGPQDSTCSPHSPSPDHPAESGLQAAGQGTAGARLWVVGKEVWRLPMRMYQRWKQASAGYSAWPLRDHIRPLAGICPCRLAPRVPELGLAARSLLEKSVAARVGLTSRRPGRGRRGRGRRRGSPASGEEPARVSRVPLAGAEGFPH